jgi:hypothetical protein
MEQTHSENLQLGRLVADAVVEIERLGYSRRSRNRYRAIWEHLIEFSHQRTWGTNFQRIWRHAFWRSSASGMSRWMGRAMEGVGMWRSA